MELVASGTGIADLARKMLKDQRSPEELEHWTAEDVFNEARNGEEWAIDLVHDTVDCIALTIANINAVFDPDLIVMGGGIVQSNDLFLSALHERIETIGPLSPKVVITTLREKAAVMGTIIKILYRAEKHYVIRTMS